MKTVSVLQRLYQTPNECTIGELIVPGVKPCFILEDIARPEKIKGETRIPAGIYRLGFFPNSRFDAAMKRLMGKQHIGMIWIQNVPEFNSILFHPGNHKNDTEGCILPGSTVNKEKTMVLYSRETYKRIYPVWAKLVHAGDSWLEVRDEK